MEERRDFTRIPTEAQMNISLVPEGEPGKAVSKNLSGAGILFSSETRYEPGTLLDIEVISPSHENIAHVFEPMRKRIRVLRVEKDDRPPYDIAGEFVQTES